MLRRGLTLAFVALPAASAWAQETNWTGWQAGFHAGGSLSQTDSSFSDASRFCHTSTTTTGAGEATATCEVGNAFAGTTGTAVVPDGAGGSATAGASVADANNLTQAAAGASASPPFALAEQTRQGGTGPASGSASAAANDTVDGGAASRANSVAGLGNFASSITQTKAENSSGTAETISLALANAFDLGDGGDADQTNVGFGAHLGYLHQRQGRSLVFGFEADVTALFGGEETISETSALNRPAGIAGAASGAGAGFGADVLPFASTSEPAESYYQQSVNVDTKVLSSLRAKIGVAKRIYFPYVTAGVALAHYSVDAQSVLKVSAEDLNTETGVSLSSSKSWDETTVGGVVGGGISMKLKEFILSAEGLYYFFDDDVDVSSGFLNSAQRSKITFDNIAEVRFKVSIPLN